jgi:probable rRNA maturation factor
VEVNLGPQSGCADREAIVAAVRAAAAYRGCRQGTIGVAVVDDAAIHAVNQRHLQHDYPTDVISFTYALDPPHVEGELVVSWQTAERASLEAGWPAADELILYVVHGTLHITGMDDASSDQRQAMRGAEREVLAQLGIGQPPAAGADAGTATPAAGGRQQ